jgi:hypothetical protein
MDNDVGMVRQLAEELAIAAVELPFVSKLLSEAMAKLGEDADHAEVYALTEQATCGASPRHYRRRASPSRTR